MCQINSFGLILAELFIYQRVQIIAGPATPLHNGEMIPEASLLNRINYFLASGIMYSVLELPGK